MSAPTIEITCYGAKRTLHAEVSQYGNGRTAVQLVDPEDWMEPLFTTITVNMPDQHLNAGELFVKDWSENEPIVPALVAAGWLEPAGREVASGFVNPKVMRPAGALADYLKEIR